MLEDNVLKCNNGSFLKQMKTEKILQYFSQVSWDKLITLFLFRWRFMVKNLGIFKSSHQLKFSFKLN